MSALQLTATRAGDTAGMRGRASTTATTVVDALRVTFPTLWVSQYHTS
jgi:hypothetical protein